MYAMVVRRALRVLQANLRKGPETHLSLQNDRPLQSCDVLRISEPYVFVVNDTVRPRHHPTLDRSSA